MAVLLTLGAVAPVLGQDPHAGHGDSMDPASMDPASMDHSAMDHAAMDHAAHPPGDAGVEQRSHRATDLHIPDIELLDQNGEKVHFYSDLVADKLVAVNFIFTTCTTVCPPMGAIFGKLHRELGERAGQEVHLISVSIDPVTDTPPRLKAWAEKFGGGDGWTLVTGPKADVDQVLQAFEVLTPDPQDHSPTVLLGNAASGEWQRAYGLTAPAKLVTMLDAMNTAEAKEAGR